MTREFTFLFKPKPSSKLAVVRADPAATTDNSFERQGTEDPAIDLDYLQSRAEQEVAQAQRARDPAVVAIHFELAERYLERVSQVGVPMTQSKP